MPSPATQPLRDGFKDLRDANLLVVVQKANDRPPRWPMQSVFVQNPGQTH
jgi:hypothetical protein